MKEIRDGKMYKEALQNLGVELYKCVSCGFVAPLNKFKNLENGGDVMGVCPHCENRGVIGVIVGNTDDNDSLNIGE